MRRSGKVHLQDAEQRQTVTKFKFKYCVIVSKIRNKIW